jgi:hypothetical protein
MAEPTQASISIYSPYQIYFASFVGGPLAGAWYLAQNYRAIANIPAARRSLVVGCLAVLAMLPLLFVLPKKFPNLVIPIAYSAAFYFFAQQRFVVDSARGIRFGSGWRHWTNVVGVSVFLLVLTLALWVGGLILLDRIFPGRRP